MHSYGRPIWYARGTLVWQVLEEGRLSTCKLYVYSVNEPLHLVGGAGEQPEMVPEARAGGAALLRDD